MRALLLLSVVGAALFLLLLVTDNALRVSETEKAVSHALPSPPADRTLRAWGSNLPALVRQPAARPPQSPGGSSDKDKQLAVSGNPPEVKVDGTGQEPVEWAKVVLAARAHSEPSVSSPTIRFYTMGAELQVVGRRDGWIALLDPATQERGWVFEPYVSAIEMPSRTTVDSPIEVEFSKPKLTNAALPTSKPRSRSAKPAAQVSDKYVTKSELQRGRWSKRDDRRRRFGLFRRRFATFDSW
jgi:hypothetical protein